MDLLRFHPSDYVTLVRILIKLEADLKADEVASEPPPGAHIILSDDRADEAKSAFDICRKLFKEVHLPVSAVHAEELARSATERNRLDSEDIRALEANVWRELKLQFFVGIQPDRIELFTSGPVKWREIAAKFPSATEDIEEMNKCFALCRYSASVFHSLLVVEHGLVALGTLIGTTDPKPGWDASCRKLENVIKDGRKKNTTGVPFEFLEQVNVCIQAMKLAWRNKVNHATGKPIVMSGGFPEYVAEDIIAASLSFLRRLGEGLS